MRTGLLLVLLFRCGIAIRDWSHVADLPPSASDLTTDGTEPADAASLIPGVRDAQPGVIQMPASSPPVLPSMAASGDNLSAKIIISQTEPPPLWHLTESHSKYFVACRCEEIAAAAQQDATTWIDPCDEEDETCRAEGMGVADAAVRCSSRRALPDGHRSVAFVTRVRARASAAGSYCTARTCCKELPEAEAEIFDKDYAGHRLALQDWLLESVGEYMEAANHAMDRSRKLWDENQTFVGAEEQEALAMIAIQLMNASEAGLDAIATCANTADDGISVYCGNTFQFGEQTQLVLNTLFGVLKEYNQLLNLVFLGARRPFDPRAWPRLLLRFGSRAVHVMQSSALLSQGIGHAVGAAWVRFRDTCWAKRHIIFGAGALLMNGAQMGNIIMNTMVATTSGSGIVKVAEALMAEITIEILCPLAANAVALGFIAQWLVEKVLENDAAMSLLKSLAWPLEKSKAGWLALRKLLGKHNQERVDQYGDKLVEFVKDLNNNPWAFVVYTFLFSSVSSMLRVFSAIGCSTLGAASKTLNIAGDAVGGGTKGMTNWFNREIVATKSHFGVDTRDVKEAMARQHMLEASHEVKPWHAWLREIHRSIVDAEEAEETATEMMSGVGQTGLHSLNLLLEGVSKGGRATLALCNTLGKFFGKVDTLPGLIAVIGSGTAGAIGLTRMLSSAWHSLRDSEPDVKELRRQLELDEASFGEHVVAEAQLLKLRATHGSGRRYDDVWSQIREAHLLAFSLDVQLKGEDLGAQLMAAQRSPLPQVDRIGDCPASWKLPWNRLGDACLEACGAAGLCSWCGERRACCSSQSVDGEPAVCHAARALGSTPPGTGSLGGGDAREEICMDSPKLEGTRFDLDDFNTHQIWQQPGSVDNGKNLSEPLPACKPDEFPAQCIIQALATADDGLNHAGEDCWDECQHREGECDFCGTGKCCRYGWGRHRDDEGCWPFEGIQGRHHHVCVPPKPSLPEYFKDPEKCKGDLLLLEVTPTNPQIRAKLFDTQPLYLPLRYTSTRNVIDTGRPNVQRLLIEGLHDGIGVSVAKGTASFEIVGGRGKARELRSETSVRVRWNISEAVQSFGAPQFTLTEVHGVNPMLGMVNGVITASRWALNTSWKNRGGARHDVHNLPVVTAQKLKYCYDHSHDAALIGDPLGKNFKPSYN
mmetsp:Transcript_102506/g.182118  ORF Transcript_102506/g.182118 Transcript_102506/m.182118 type:complete len:1159 (-) Transcript_102506:60-3536(-)